MSFYKQFQLLLLSLTLLAAGCRKYNKNIKNNVLAQVGPEILTVQQARQNIPDFIYQQDSLEAIKNYRTDWIEARLIAQEAQRLGLNDKPEVQQRIEELKADIYRVALKNAVLKNDTTTISVSTQEAKNYYERYKEQFLLQERYVRFRHLKTETLEQSRQAKSALLQGTNWREVVETYGIDKKETLSNSAKFWPISMAISDLEPLNRYLEIIGINEISPIRRLNGQYHFVQLVEQYAKGEHPNLDWLLQKIQQWLTIEKRRKLFNNYIRSLYLQAESNNEIILFNVLNDSLANDSLDIGTSIQNTE